MCCSHQWKELSSQQRPSGLRLLCLSLVFFWLDLFPWIEFVRLTQTDSQSNQAMVAIYQIYSRKKNLCLNLIESKRSHSDATLNAPMQLTIKECCITICIDALYNQGELWALSLMQPTSATININITNWTVLRSCLFMFFIQSYI